MGQKLGGVGVPFFLGVARSTLSKMSCRRPRPTSVPSGIIQPFGHINMGRKLGARPLFGRWGAGSPSNRMSLGLRPISLPSGILIHPAIWLQQIWAKIGGCAPLGEEEQDPHLEQCGLGRDLPPCQVASWSLQPSGHNRHGTKIGGVLPPFWGGGAGSPSNTMSLGLRPTSPYQVASWSIQPFGDNRYGPKIVVSASFWGRGAGSPSNRMWPGQRPTCRPSFVLIQPTVWPQYTSVTDRTDNGLIA